MPNWYGGSFNAGIVSGPRKTPWEKELKVEVSEVRSALVRIADWLLEADIDMSVREEHLSRINSIARTINTLDKPESISGVGSSKLPPMSGKA